jgi:hypothetical protein
MKFSIFIGSALFVVIGPLWALPDAAQSSPVKSAELKQKQKDPASHE